MQTRDFIFNNSSITKNCKEAMKRYQEMCEHELEQNGLVAKLYLEIKNNADEVIRKLFFENVSMKLKTDFVNHCSSCGLEKFIETYKQVGKYGTKHFTSTIRNNIQFV